MAELDTGGVDLGTMGQVHGHLPGLSQIADVAAVGGSVLAERALRPKPGKDFNDAPVDPTVGTHQGQKVVEDTGASTWTGTH